MCAFGGVFYAGVFGIDQSLDQTEICVRTRSDAISV